MKLAETFTCAACGGTFEVGWSDEEAEAEKAQNFPAAVAAGEEFELVCDDCYPLFFAKEETH